MIRHNTCNSCTEKKRRYGPVSWRKRRLGVSQRCTAGPVQCSISLLRGGLQVFFTRVPPRHKTVTNSSEPPLFPRGRRWQATTLHSRRRRLWGHFFSGGRGMFPDPMQLETTVTSSNNITTAATTTTTSLPQTL